MIDESVVIEEVAGDIRAIKAIEKLRVAQEVSMADPEAGHAIADDILCGLLVKLGFAEVVDEWQKVDKWYG